MMVQDADMMVHMLGSQPGDVGDVSSDHVLSPVLL
jgi:hypothetical protein